MNSPKKISEQSKRFIEAAREHETDESPEAFERAFAKVVPAKRAKIPTTKPDKSK